MMPIHPTLAAMTGVYQLSREGGASSPRFHGYVALAGISIGLSGYNPMTGPAALEACEHLLAIDAEGIAARALDETTRKCDFAQELTLALTVASKGMWTDRLGTEVQHRMNMDRTPDESTILLWTREPIEASDVRREATAEVIRTMWTVLHGQATTLGTMLAREGLAYAAALNDAVIEHDVVGAGFAEAAAILGDTSNHGDIVAALYGDVAAELLGYTTLGLPERAGYRWASARANAAISERGAAEGLRTYANALTR